MHLNELSSAELQEFIIMLQEVKFAHPVELSHAELW